MFKAGAWEAFNKLKGNLLQPINLPSSAARDTQESIRIINDQMFSGTARDFQTEMLEVMKAAADHEKSIKENMEIVARYYKDHPETVPQVILKKGGMN